MSKRGMAQSVTDLDYGRVSLKIQQFISERTREAGSSGVVIGVSGGIDSSVVLTLAAKALTPHRVLGLLMPRKNITPAQDIKDAELLAIDLGVEYRIIDIDRICTSFLEHLVPSTIPQGNLIARIRMSILYYHANLMGRLVVGTGDKSEELIGYFTKFGDGGVDILPIGDLYKTQVRELGRWMGLPGYLVEKKSSPMLWAGHDAQAEIGISYEIIDQVLHGMIDQGMTPKILSTQLGIRNNVVERIQVMINESKHKRSVPEICKLG
ncbi:MAG: NAD+ synthase [Nitrososphaerales archaeon]